MSLFRVLYAVIERGPYHQKGSEEIHPGRETPWNDTTGRTLPTGDIS